MGRLPTRRSMELGACAIVTATAAGCAVSHTSTAVTTRPTITYVEDHIGSTWPVAQATAAWQRATREEDVRYGRCRRGAGCIRVRVCTDAEAAADPGTVGRTLHEDDGAGAYEDVCVGSGPDDTYLDGFALAIVCHEIGHGLGLGHNEDPDSCMHAVVDRPPFSDHPGRRDAEILDGDGG